MTRAHAPRQVLNLLAHLESHRRFAKFLKRDHGIAAEDVGELEETIPPAAPTPAAAPTRVPNPAAEAERPAAQPAAPAGRGRGKDLNQPAWLKTGDLGPEAAAVCRGAWARVTIDHFRHFAMQTFLGHRASTDIFFNTGRRGRGGGAGGGAGGRVR